MKLFSEKISRLIIARMEKEGNQKEINCDDYEKVLYKTNVQSSDSCARSIDQRTAKCWWVMQVFNWSKNLFLNFFEADYANLFWWLSRCCITHHWTKITDIQSDYHKFPFNGTQGCWTAIILPLIKFISWKFIQHARKKTEKLEKKLRLWRKINLVKRTLNFSQQQWGKGIKD